MNKYVRNVFMPMALMLAICVASLSWMSLKKDAARGAAIHQCHDKVWEEHDGSMKDVRKFYGMNQSQFLPWAFIEAYIHNQIMLCYEDKQ